MGHEETYFNELGLKAGKKLRQVDMCLKGKANEKDGLTMKWKQKYTFREE